MNFVQNEKTDEEVASSVQNGEKEDFGILVDRYEKKILRYGRKFLATFADVEDITQDVFMNAYKKIKSFDPGQKFSPWIYRIAHNAFVNAMKRNSFRPMTFFDFDTFVSFVAYDDPVEKEREQAEMQDMINKGLEKLPNKYKEILILYYQEELGYKEISEILKIPTGTVGARLARGKSALRKIYQDLNKQYE